MALKDTEEKISRCPKRVSVSGLLASFSGSSSVPGKKHEAQCLISSLGATSRWGSNPCLELAATFHAVPTHCTTASRNRGTEVIASASPRQSVATCKPLCAAGSLEPVSWGGNVGVPQDCDLWFGKVSCSEETLQSPATPLLLGLLGLFLTSVIHKHNERSRRKIKKKKKKEEIPCCAGLMSCSSCQRLNVSDDALKKYL